MTRGPGPDPPSLDAVLDALGLAAHELQAFDPVYPRFDAQRPLLVLAAQFEAAAPLIATRYPAEHPAPALANEVARDANAGALPADADAWLLAALPPEEDVRAAAGLRAIMARLYGPDGCPWDRQQTHESLRSYLLEESYEAVEAIDRGDLDGLREELGDLLMQIVFHATIAEAHDEFALEDVVEAISTKMLRRHPHVFGADEVADADEVWSRWEAIKAQERAARGDGDPWTSGLASVPRALPALLRAQTLIGRVERAELAADEPPPLEAIDAALRAIESEPTAEALGALLWAAVRYARAHDLDAESTLREQANRFLDSAMAST